MGYGEWDVAVALVESVGDLVGLGCRFSLPVVAPYAPQRGSFVGAEVERRQPKPRRALRGFWLHPVHFFCACHLPAGPETAAKPVRRRSPRLLPPGCLLQVCIHGHKMELSRELQWRVSTGIGRERCTHLGYTPYCHSP